MDECSSGSGLWRRCFFVAVFWVSAALVLSGINGGAETGNPLPEGQSVVSGVDLAEGGAVAPAVKAAPLSAAILSLIVLLLALSAFFSACEVAFFSLGPLRVRAMSHSTSFLDHEVARLMRHPDELLTSILMGNCIVNVLLSVVLANPVESRFERVFAALFVNPNENAFEQALPATIAYICAVVFCTGLLVFLGEILPKLFVVRNNAIFARFAALPLHVASALLQPLRHGVIYFVGYLFRVTRFSLVRPAPFMTDQEFAALLSEGEATGAIERDEREMIQGILKGNDIMVRDILVPRPDIMALNENATVAEALELICEHEYSRIPVYRENLDHIAGILYAKDLLALADQNDMAAPIQALIRKAHYVPETMTVLEFMKSVQRLRTHVAIVVDEFGGTEGLVTLHDALREIVGDIEAEDRDEPPMVQEIEQNLYEVDGRFPLDELESITGVPVVDDEHSTVAGFLMEQSDKVLEVGDKIDHEGVLYTVEEMDGKRVSRLLVQTSEPQPANGETPG